MLLAENPSQEPTSILQLEVKSLKMPILDKVSKEIAILQKVLSAYLVVHVIFLIGCSKGGLYMTANGTTENNTHKSPFPHS